MQKHTETLVTTESGLACSSFLEQRPPVIPSPEAHGLAHPVAQAHEPVYLLLAECSRLLCGSAPANSKGYLDTEVSAQQLFAESSNKPRIFLINNWAA
jgi:hypothetical protein